ncbi:hypothetical protein NL108_018108, partial [Boleophthalmus pectinirostris]
REELSSWFRRGEEMDQMLTEKDRKLAEKEAYIVHLQTAMGGEQPTAPPKETENGGSLVDLQNLVQNLTKKIGEAEERYSLLQEQSESLKELLSTEQEQFTKKEDMYKQNIQTFKDIILQKDNQLMEMSQMHEQELFRLAAKSDASADLEQLLKALKQKLHEKEEVLLGKNQVIDVLQGEVDTRDGQIKELLERLKRVQVEQKSLESKTEAERHVMKAQIRDLMEKHQSEVQRMKDLHQEEISRTQQEILQRVEERRREEGTEEKRRDEGETETKSPEKTEKRITQLEAKVKEKTEEANKSEAKFLKIKAWSKSRIKQLEEELRRSQAGSASPDLDALQAQITALEEEREENLWKLEHYQELRAKNEMLEAKLVLYEEQQRTLQADLEQFTKRATSQASEAGSADDPQVQVLEWQEMVAEAVSARERAQDEKNALSVRINQLEEEKEALASRHQELEEELAQSRGLSPAKGSGKSGRAAERSLQEDFELDGHAPLFPTPRSPPDSAALVEMEGENMGGWWPEFSSPDPGGLRSVVEELELERNQLQEQILSLEERCQDLEDRLQLQARIETLQNETERLQGQLANARSQQSRDAEKHQLLVSSLNQQLKGLSETQETLETSLLEKETSLAQTSEKLEVINGLKGALRESEEQSRELSERLTHTQHNLEEVLKKCSVSEQRCSALKNEVGDLTQKLCVLKEKAQKQESTIETLQTELDQTNEELDKLNSAHLEERAQLIHDLQTCEREIDNLKDALSERDKEIATLTANMTEYADQIAELKQEIRLKEQSLVQVENALQKSERDAMVLRESQTSDQQVLNSKISEMVEKIKEFEVELSKTKDERDAKGAEVEQLVKQADKDKKLIQELRSDVQKQTNSHRNHLSECETHINSLKEQLTSAHDKLNEEISKLNSSQGTLQQKEEMWENELKSYKDENNSLLAQVDKFNSEIKTLSDDFKAKLEIITTLERRIDEERTKYNSKLQERDSENLKMKSELQSKSENMSKLKNALKNLKAEKGQLQEKMTSLNQEFDLDKQKLNREIQDLREIKSKLENEIALHLGAISELNNEKVGLNAKITQLDAANLENAGTIETLRKENEDLRIQTGDLNKVLEQSTHSNSEILLAKTNECTHLSQVLREKEEEMARLRDKVDGLSSKVGNLERELTEKDGCISELRSNLDELQNRRKQLEESLSKMEQQEEHVRSELCQKDAVLTEKHAESLKFSNEIANLQNKEELDNANGLVQSLQSQVGSMEEDSRKLQSELETSRAECVNLQKHMESTMAENRNLSSNVESKDAELAQAAERHANLTAQVGKLVEDNKRLEQDLERNSREIDALKNERSSLQEQVLSDKTVIEGLVKEKDDITLTIVKLNKALNENEILNSEKTNECVNLLREKEEFAQGLQKEIGELKTEIDRLNGALSESKDQQLQVEDTVSMLREQGAALKSALMEKDAMLTQKTDEIKRQNEVISTMQKDLDSLREESRQKTRDIEQKELSLTEMSKELQHHKDELDKRNESVLTLSSQLGVMNENAVEMESELNNLKATMEKLASENAQLVQDAERNKTKLVDFEDGVQVLKEQNSSLKTELLKNVNELETLKAEIANYRAAVKESETKMTSLSDELKLERERLSQTEQGNEETLKQKQDLVQNLNTKVTEQQRELQQRNSENEKLVAQVLEFQKTVQNLTSESQLLKASLEQKEKSSLELENASSATVKKLSSNLQNKTVECESLKERISSLEEATRKLQESLQGQVSETQKLQKALGEKEAVLAEQSKNIRMREDEALMYKSQFVESTELVSKLQSECGNLRKESEEIQSAFKNLQDKYAAHLEELRSVKDLLSQKDDAVLSLQKLLENGSSEQQNAQSTIEKLKNELADVYKQLENAQKAGAALVEEKDAALASHQENVERLTVEVDRLKSQHVQVVTQMDALTGNIEQREMALHAINNQYAAQAKHAAQLVAQIQILEEQNTKEKEAFGKENAKLQDRVRKLVQEKEELLTKRKEAEESKTQKERESSDAVKRLTAENETLQAKVSAQNDDVVKLKENIVKLEQILQDSEKEWLLVLEKEKQDKNLMAEELKCVENEIKCKDVKVTALKEDLDSLQEKLAEAALAVKQGSERLVATEQEAAASKKQLENVLALIQEKDDVNNHLQQMFESVEGELRRLTNRSDKNDDPKEKSAYLLGLVKDLEQSYTCEIDALKRTLDDTTEKLKNTESNVEKGDFEKGQQINVLQESLNQVQRRLDGEAEKVREAAEKYALLYRDVKAKDEHINRLEVQITQQQELLAALSQQLKEKDVSIAQVIESAANERVKFTEEIADWKEQLEKSQNELRASAEKSQREADSANLETDKKIEELKTELARTTKERDAAKKKLQAALVVRKELMKKIETYENVDIVGYKSELSQLSERLQELEKQLEEGQRKYYKDQRLVDATQKVDANSSTIEQLKANLTELQEEKHILMQKSEELQSEIKTASAASASVAEFESEMAQVKKEKAVLQKKAQAAMLARKETVKKSQENEKKLMQELAEVKEEYGKLTQQNDELNAARENLERKVDEIQKLSNAYQTELEDLKLQFEARESSLQEKESQCQNERKNKQENVKTLEEQLEILKRQQLEANEVGNQENKILLEKYDQLKTELDTALSESEMARQDCNRLRRNFEMEKEEKERLTVETTSLKMQLVDAEKQIEKIEERANIDLIVSEKDEVISQKSAEIFVIQKCLEETQRDREVIAAKLAETSQNCAKFSKDLELERREKENALGLCDRFKRETSLLEMRLNESQKQNAELQETSKNKEAVVSELSEKKELIAALEKQLEEQVRVREVAVEKLKIETTEVQKSTEDSAKMKEMENKMSQLTKKLQAALLSRKELMKDNAKLKEDMESLSSKYDAKEVDFQAVESSNSNLKQQNSDLKNSLEILSKENNDSKVELEAILADNRSLSAACESLKQTIENITQQKRAFSCQLESLKDSETEELTKWKTKHAELKQEYESLLQAYENVSSEMDKMRQVLEGAKRERQEALRKKHKLEMDLENLEKQIRNMEEENEKLRDGMQGISQDKIRRITELEEDSKRIGRLESENTRFLETIEDFKKKVDTLEKEKQKLVENLSEVNSTLENQRQEAKLYAEKMQNKLDEALDLNNSLTVRIETQKTELGAQIEINQILQNEKQNLMERIDRIQNDHEAELANKEEAIRELNELIAEHTKEKISLNEKVRILEDDKSLLQEELENAQETSDKVKNENEYLETVILKNSEKIDELTESISTMQSQSAQLSSQLTSIKEMSDKIRQEKEQEQIKLVKEFEEKLKTMQRGNEGSKNVKKELQELLKEKHQEINLLQQNCIKSQEVILNLESELKASQLKFEQSSKDLKQHVERISNLEERKKQLENDLTTCKSLLNDAKEKISRFEAEREQLRIQLEQSKRREQEKLSKNIEEVDLFVEKNVLQQQISDLKTLSSSESQKVMELQRKIDSQELQMSVLKRDAETKEAKLSALESAGSGGDAAKTWNDLYQKALSEKDNQLLEQGFVIKRFLEETRLKDKEVNELRVAKSKLERAINEYSVAAAAHQRQLFVMSASNAELTETLETLTVQVNELTAQVERMERDRNALTKQVVDKEDAVSQTQLKLEQVEKLYSEAEAQLSSLQAQNDKLQVEFDKQEGITQQLKVILQSKNSEISSLLSCKEGQMSGYLEQLQANYQSQMSVYEDRLTSARYQKEKNTKEIRTLEAKVKSLQIQVGKAVQEKNSMAVKMESFKNSLVSLQNEREKLMSEYKLLEAKSKVSLSTKTGGEGGATKGLKHEIRKLLHQMDDLNSENAMLRAQLVRYREDLNQVLSLKDNQLKILLKKQQDTIKQLENDKMASEKQIREARLDSEKREELNETLKTEISKLKSQISKLEHDRKEMTTSNEGKVIVDLQNAVVAKSAECNDLQQKLTTEKNLKEELRTKLQKIENETDKKLAEAEDKYNGELDNFEREVNLMRNEKETADQRVAELAKDLLELEQQLSDAKTQNGDFKTQNESLCKAMAALQNDRHQLIEDFKTLRIRYDDELRETQASLKKMENKFTDATSELAALAKQRDVLVHKLKALESKDVQNEINRLVDELGKALSEKEGEVTRFKMENESCNRQLSAFSKSMASLQNDRDRLEEELAGAKR